MSYHYYVYILSKRMCKCWCFILLSPIAFVKKWEMNMKMEIFFNPWNPQIICEKSSSTSLQTLWTDFLARWAWGQKVLKDTMQLRSGISSNTAHSSRLNLLTLNILHDISTLQSHILCQTFHFKNITSRKGSLLWLNCLAFHNKH